MSIWITIENVCCKSVKKLTERTTTIMFLYDICMPLFMHLKCRFIYFLIMQMCYCHCFEFVGKGMPFPLLGASYGWNNEPNNSSVFLLQIKVDFKHANK